MGQKYGGRGWTDTPAGHRAWFSPPDEPLFVPGTSCSGCGTAIRRGADARNFRDGHIQRWRHVACPAVYRDRRPARDRTGLVCPTCGLVMPLTQVCDNCGPASFRT